MISSLSGLAGAPDRPARVAHDEALAEERLAALDADAIGGGHEHRVGVRAGHAQDVGHGLAVVGLVGHRYPVGGDADDVRALERAEAVALGEPAVVADERPDSADRRPPHREAEIARLEEQRLLVPEVHLAKRADVPGRGDHHGGVVQLLAAVLVDSRHQVQVVRPSELRPGAARRPTGDFLGQRERLGA